MVRMIPEAVYAETLDDVCETYDVDEQGEDIEEDEDDTPSEEDYTITPAGSLGGCYAVGVVGGRFLGQFAELDHAERAIRAQMARDNYWPDIWSISDHGHVSRHTMHK